MIKCVYLIKAERCAYDTNDITATYTDIVGFVEDENIAKEYCLKRNDGWEYGSYSYECVSELTVKDLMED